MLMVPTRRTQAERRAATRAALLEAARGLFAERGFAATGREDVAERAGVTRGALYHHFESMTALAIAVVEDVDAELQDRVVQAAAKGRSPLDALLRSCDAYLDACAEPGIARIVAEAPGFVGADVLHDLGDRSCARLLEGGLGDGLDPPGDRAVAARVLLAMLDEAAMVVAREPRARTRVRSTVRAMVERLFA
jgi:AcrR family transcriptional regulator